MQMIKVYLNIDEEVLGPIILIQQRYSTLYTNN